MKKILLLLLFPFGNYSGKRAQGGQGTPEERGLRCCKRN